MTDTLWVEKYRPETIDDVVGHDAITERLSQLTDDAEMPHLCLAGKQGIGKTAVIQGFLREVYGDDWRTYLLGLNASDERGIDVVRDKIKSFAQQGSGPYDYKVVWLDEADQLTTDAQPAMRRTMEDYSDETRFILSCNYPGQIIDPILSRTVMLNLSPLTEDELSIVVTNVLDAEDVDYSADAVGRIVADSRGDARRAINHAQFCTLNGTLTPEDVDDVLGTVSDDDISQMVDDAINGEYEDAMEAATDLVTDGVSTDNLLEAIQRDLEDRDIPEDVAVKAADALGEADHRLRIGANPHVQLHALLANLKLAKHASVV